MKTAEEFRQTLEGVFKMKAAMVEEDPPYGENKYESTYETEALNEGYKAGLLEAIRVIQASEFLCN